MKELYHRANKGDKDAIQEVLKEIEPVLNHIAYRYHSYGMDKDDIMQVMRTGAWQAMVSFNPQKVDGKADVAKIFLMWTIRLAEQFLWRDFRGRNPERRGHKATTELSRCISLDDEINSFRDSSMKIEEIIEDKNAVPPVDIVSKDEETNIINSLIERLNKEEKIIIELRYVEGMSFSHIGKKLAKSKQWIFVVHEKALEQLKKWWNWERKYGGRLTTDEEVKKT